MLLAHIGGITTAAAASASCFDTVVVNAGYRPISVLGCRPLCC